MHKKANFNSKVIIQYVHLVQIVETLNLYNFFEKLVSEGLTLLFVSRRKLSWDKKGSSTSDFLWEVFTSSYCKIAICAGHT